MWCTASTYSGVWYFAYCYTWSCVVLWVLLIERAFSSVLLNVCGIACSDNLCIMDTLGLFICVLIIRVSMIIQVSLQIHAKAYFGTMTKCVNYAGVLIFKYPDWKVLMYCICVGWNDRVNRGNSWSWSSWLG